MGIGYAFSSSPALFVRSIMFLALTFSNEDETAFPTGLVPRRLGVNQFDGDPVDTVVESLPRILLTCA